MGAIDLSRYLWPSIAEGRQPQHPAKINRDNPLGAKVVYASTLAGVAVDLATGKTGVNTAAVPKATPRGMALNFNGSSAFITLPTTNLVAGYPLTVSCWFEKKAAASGVIYSLNGSGYSAVAGRTGTNLIFNVGSSSTNLGYTYTSIPEGWNHLTVVHRAGSHLIFLNGANVTSSEVVGSVFNWGQPAAGNHSIGNRLNGSSPQYFNGGIQDFIVFRGELSADEAKQVYLDPYQIFSEPAPIWLGVTAGSTAAALATDAVAQASASAALTAGSGLSASAQAAAAAAAALSTGIAMQGAAVAQASATAALGIPLAIEAPADRGTLDLTNCSITPNGLTPQINLKNRYIGDANTTGARFTFGRLTGVNGMTPVIKVDRSNMEINASAKFLWSTTGLKGSWVPFANFTSNASFFTVSHNAAFTSDTIYFASNNPWPVGYTLPWIQSLEATGFVSYAPSGGASYQFGTRTATTNGATAGVGDVIAAQPLYSFKISSGAGNAPDGLPKRSIVLLSGTHAAEDVGNYALEGAVAFLVSADSQAVTLRDWCNVYVYPLTATAGRAGGGQRNDFENTLKTTDVNREWPNATLETVNKHKTAIQTDAGSTLAMLLDFHGTHLSNEGAYDWYNGLRQSTWTNAIRTYLAGLEIRSNGTAGLASKWSVDSKSARHGVSPEYPYHNDEVMASLLTYGESHMRAIAHLAAAGEFVGLTGSAAAQASASASLTATTAIQLAGAAISIASASGALSTAIPLSGVAASQATAAANLTAGGGLSANAQAAASTSGALTAQIRITGNALAQAISSAALSSGIIMSAAAVSQAAAQGTLATAIRLIASATGQATASASLTAASSGLSADAQAVASANAALTIQIRLSANAVAQASAQGALTAYFDLSADALAAAVATGALTTQVTFSADAFAQALAVAVLAGSAYAADVRYAVRIPARRFYVAQKNR